MRAERKIPNICIQFKNTIKAQNIPIQYFLKYFLMLMNTSYMMSRKDRRESSLLVAVVCLQGRDERWFKDNPTPI